MIVRFPERQADGVLAAMRAIARVHGPERVTEVDQMTVEAAARIVFGRPEGDLGQIEVIGPSDLATLFADEEEAEQAGRMLAVMSIVDGALDPAKQQLLEQYTEALGVDQPYLKILHESVFDELNQANACIIRKNAESFPHLDLTGIDEDAVAPFLPYRDNPDPELAARYGALGKLPAGTFGKAFYEHFKLNRFSWPGEPDGLSEGFTTPHDSSHVLSGYSTSPEGETCVSTFIGGMHPEHPMSAEVLPVLFSWHLGIHLNDIAGATTGSYDPRRFWTAWQRGAATEVDVVAADWDFWGATEIPLDELRREYGIPDAAPDLRP